MSATHSFMPQSTAKALLCKAGENWNFRWWRKHANIITCVSTWLQWNSISSQALINAVCGRIDVAAKTTASHLYTTTHNSMNSSFTRENVSHIINISVVISSPDPTPLCWLLDIRTTLCLKKTDTKLWAITSPNVNRFSKFFHWQICNKLIFKYSTTP